MTAGRVLCLYRSTKVIISHLAVVLVSDLDRVTQPRRNHMARKSLVSQFGCPTRSEILKQFGPRLDSGPLQDLD